MRADRLSEDLNPGLGGRPSIPYGDSVKRHLDIYDVEASLNEVCLVHYAFSRRMNANLVQITDLSARTWDFSRRYGIRAHQTQRSGPVLGSLPTLGEVEDMIHMQRRNEEALMRIRAAVVSQEHAMAEQMAQRKALKPGMHEDDHMGMYQEEFKGGGGFAGAESKKRRGVSPPSDLSLPLG